jgi:hypothetical protein
MSDGVDDFTIRFEGDDAKVKHMRVAKKIDKRF